MVAVVGVRAAVRRRPERTAGRRVRSSQLEIALTVTPVRKVCSPGRLSDGLQAFVGVRVQQCETGHPG